MTTTKNELIDLTLSSDEEDEIDDDHNINVYNEADYLPFYEHYDPALFENSDDDSSDDDNDEEEAIVIEEEDNNDVAEVVLNEIEEPVNVNNEPEQLNDNNEDDDDDDDDDDGIDGYTELVDDEQELRRLARKHVAWYSKGLPGSAEFRAGINRLFGAAEVEEAIQAFYQPLLDQGLEAVRAAFHARGHASEDAELIAA
jgi:hypothetical protein